MGKKRVVSMFACLLLAACAACEDGGPPNPFRPRMRDAPATAADGGTTDASDADADDSGAEAERGETSVR